VKVTREVALEGIVRHTADARHRIEDGLSLFEQLRYGTAVILGTIALENIGRAYWLASLADDGSRLSQLSVKSLRSELRKIDHQERLKQGLRGFSMDNAPTISARILSTRHADWDKVLARNLEAIWSVYRKAPATLHDARTKAQYPELNEAGSWRSSADVGAATAKNTLRQASENFYMLQAFCLEKIVGLRELSKELGTEDDVFGYLEPYERLGTGG
jgi:AbiV family abortive infection protein